MLSQCPSPWTRNTDFVRKFGCGEMKSALQINFSDSCRGRIIHFEPHGHTRFPGEVNVDS